VDPLNLRVATTVTQPWLGFLD